MASRAFGKLFLQVHFIFFDYSEPVIFFILDYVEAMGLFVLIGHYLVKGLTGGRRKQKNETNKNIFKKRRINYGSKKIVSMMLIATMATGQLAGCGQRGSTQDTVTEAVTEQAQETETESAAESEQETGASQETGEEAADTQEGSSDVLVVYYSATGNTQAVAESIAEATGGDLFQLEPAQPYTAEDLDWTNEDSRVSQEYADESLRDVELVSAEVDNWTSYDTVFIGYPIWWGIAAWPMDTFVEANNFTGKTVIPFCTSSSSGIGDSGNLLAEEAGTGDWQDGERFRSGVDEADVQEWVNGLGL